MKQEYKKEQEDQRIQIHKKIIGNTEYIITSIHSGSETISEKILKLIQRDIEE